MDEDTVCETVMTQPSLFHDNDNEGVLDSEEDDLFYILESQIYDSDDRSGEGKRLADIYLEKLKK